jgi:hypothetical protein
MSLRQSDIGIHPMKGLPEHHDVEAALPGVPTLERADLDTDSLVPRDVGHSGIWLNCKNIDSPREELLGRDSGSGANIEHRLRALRQKVIDELVGVAGPVLIVELRRGTK